MIFPRAHYEIEFRCHFNSAEEAYKVLPFLKASLTKEYTWFDNYHGIEVYKRGEVLRASGVAGTGGKRFFLGWKGTDSGNFANIRRELDEETTLGIPNSAIMLQFCSLQKSWTAAEIAPALEQVGYRKFMSYEGHSLTGRDDKLGVNTKLMHCPIIKWPLLVELEKLADSEGEARQCEKDLEIICRDYHLAQYLVKEEPGTLLYQAKFGK